MLSKIAIRNIRRSLRDYAVYFVTIVVGVALFYAFNAIGDQSILFDFEARASEEIFTTAELGLGVFTNVVIAVLAFLIVYANRFLIRRRKKEFGTYLLLGMKARQVSYIILLEALSVGIVSLAVGLALGFLLSQASCFFTAHLIDMPIEHYTFVFSLEGLKKTVICFAGIYVFVALFNIVTVRRCKVIDLLYARDRNERGCPKRLWPRFVGLPISVAVIAVAYHLFAKVGILGMDTPEFGQSTVLMIAGTFLFFWSAAGAVVLLLRRARGLYFRKLSMFTVSQVASRMNTAFLSLSVICIMLFLSLTVFACGNGLTALFAGGDIEKVAPYDVSVWSYAGGPSSSDLGNFERAEEWDWDMASYFQTNAPSWDGLVEGAAQLDLFAFIPDSDTYLDVSRALGDIPIFAVSGQDNAALEEYGTDRIQVVSQSQMNDALALTGQEPIELAEDEYALDNTMSATQPFAERMVASDVPVTVFGRSLTSSGEMLSQELQTTSISYTPLVLVVPDSLVEDLWDAGITPMTNVLNFNLAGGSETADEAIEVIFGEAFPGIRMERGSLTFDSEGTAWPLGSYTTAWQMVIQSGGMRLMFTYMALYIGLVFMIITAVMLAIQQLSEASDSAPRYLALAKLGCDGRMLFRSLRAQVLTYFLAPLALAICHTACAVLVVNDSLLSSLGSVDLLDAVVMTVVLTTVVYGLYAMLTYVGGKSLVRSSVGSRLLGA